MTQPTVDMEAALKACVKTKNLTGKEGILTPLIKQRRHPLIRNT